MLLFIPYKNTREVKKFPFVTFAIIAVNICLFFVLFPMRDTLADTMGFIPSELSLRQILTSMFVHINVFHLLWNMLYLWLFGPNVEDALGHIEFLLIYIGSGFAAALLQAGIVQTLIPLAAEVPVIGASGAISGILGVFAVRFYKTGINVLYMLGLRMGTLVIPAIWVLGLWLLQQFVGGIIDIAKQGTNGAAHWAHIGGMLFGIALAYGLSMSRDGFREYLNNDIKASNADKSIEKLEKALDKDPDNAEIMKTLAGILAANNNREKAVHYYNKAVDLYLIKDDRDKAAAARAEMKHYYKDAMLAPRTDYQIARFLLDAKCYEAALYILDSLYTEYPAAPEAELSIMMAGDLCLHTMNDLYGAINRYEKFNKTYPNSQLRSMADKSYKEAKEKLRIIKAQIEREKANKTE